MPDTVKAIALYNSASELQGQSQTIEATVIVEQLQNLVQSSEELRHWRTGYRNVHFTQERSPDPTPLSQDTRSTQAMPPSPSLPPPVRSTLRSLQTSWLLLSALITLTLAAAFFGVAVLWPQGIYELITLGWGVLLSVLAVIPAGYVILSRDMVDDPLSGRQAGRQVYNTSEHLAAMALIALVILVWGAYALIQSWPSFMVIPDARMYDPISTPTAISTDTLNTSVTPTATATRSISPLPTSVKPDALSATASSATAEINMTPTSTTTSTPLRGMFEVQTQTP